MADYIRKGNVTHQVGTKLPSAYPSSKVTYGNNSNVEEELDEINSNLSANNTVYSYNLSGGGFYLMRVGHTVMCVCDALMYQSGSADGYLRDADNNVIPNVPNGFKPVGSRNISVLDTLNKIRLVLSLDSNGWRFTTPSSALSLTSLRFEVCWVTNDSYPT